MVSNHTPLASDNAGVLDSQALTYEQVYIITGPSGAGKTTWCQKAASQARNAELHVAGLVSPAIYEDGHKRAIAVVDLASGQSRVLANRCQPKIEGGCEWQFNHEAIAWANRCLQSIQPGDIVFIDELGPLELVHGQGFQPAAQLLTEKRFSQAYVVVRPSLLSIAQSRWPGAHLLRLGGRLI